ncbi:MAG: MBL fold metallo-hydrolase [Candidatus Heimdallarchaeaceae archaeon]
MVKVLREVAGPLYTNSFLIYDSKSKEAMLLDVADDVTSLIKVIEKMGLKVKYIFFTHGHFDHVMGIENIRKEFPKAKIGIHKEELDTINHSGPFARMFDFDINSFLEPDIYLQDKETYYLGDEEFKLILSPGHTKASICFYFPESQILFSGDVIFKEGIGRTDLYGGNYEKLVQSIKKLYSLPKNTLVYPGHGEKDTLGRIEKRGII